jgi:potassium efflux system protein
MILRAAFLWLFLACAALAQTSDELDYTSWERTAERAESVVTNGVAINSALEVLRNDVAGWRTLFLNAQDTNSARIGTVQGQLDALGPSPVEGETESKDIAERRAALNTQLETLRAPRIRAEEAFSRANGLISEIDKIIRTRQTENLLSLAPSPLVPSSWAAGWAGASAWATGLVTEWTGVLNSPTQRTAIMQRIPAMAILMIIGLVLFLRGWRWSRRAVLLAAKNVRGAWAWPLRTVVSLLQLIIPLIGFYFVTRAIAASGTLLPRTDIVIEAALFAAFDLMAAGWLAATLFPRVPLDRPFLGLPDSARFGASSGIWGMGLTLALFEFVEILEPTDRALVAAANSVLTFPVVAIGAFFCIRFGRALTLASTPLESPDAPPAFRDNITTTVGRGIVALTALSVIAGAVGYSNIATATLFPLIQTIGIISIVLVLNRVASDLYNGMVENSDSLTEGLLPVLVGLVLFVVAIPFIALSWGARQADLTELWTAFLSGFSVGGTRISPMIFLTFATIFTAGYVITRVVQGTLRSSVLPKTRLDIGGQTALVSGVGYVGIFLAALIAITTAGIDLSSLAIVAGALSVGIGFGLQTIVSNFVSGIILLIERPVSEGDWIEVGGVMGTVRRISVRSTRIETFDRTDVIVPNADLITSHVTNWTKTNLTGRLIVSVGVAYGTDTRRVAGILQEIAEAHPMVILTPPPTIVFGGFGADSLDFEVRMILRNVNFMLSVKTDIHHAIAERFTAEDIEIPFAQRDVWLRNPETLQPGQVILPERTTPDTPKEDLA